MKNTFLENLLASMNEQSAIGSLIQNSPVCHKIFDLDLHLRFMSQSGINALGIEDVEACYCQPFPPESAPQETRTRFSEALRQAADGTSSTIEYSFVVEGEVIWFRTIFGPIVDDDNVVMCIAVDSMNITEHMTALAAMKEAERIASIGSWSWNMVTSDIKWSDNMCRLHGIEPDAFDGTLESTMSFMHPDDVGLVQETIQMMQDQGRPAPFDYRIVRKDGNIRTVHGRQDLVFNGDGDLVKMHGTVHDITESKLAKHREQDLQDRLIDVERRESLGVLAGGVAHDLNNILGPMVLLPEMVDEVLQDFPAVTDEDIVGARESLEFIEDSATRAAEVIKNLKALGQRGHIDLRPHDVDQLVRDCLRSNDIGSLRTDYSHVTIHSRLRHKNLTILADKTDLHRVLLNLIVNAVEAIPHQGHVEVEAAPVFIAERKLGYEVIEAGNYVVIHVRDTGEGISDDIVKRVFEPFATTKNTGGGRGGSGLGLSVVHSIIRDHKGYVDIERGTQKWATTFSLYFPAAAAGIQPEMLEGKDEALPRGHGRILVVDDEPGQRFIARLCLNKLGYTVAEAVNGREAMHFFENHDGRAHKGLFDLVILDMVMEAGFDGLDTYNELLKLSPDQKVIISSGQAENDRVKAAMDLGAAWLAKPYGAAALASAVRQKLDEKT